MRRAIVSIAAMVMVASLVVLARPSQAQLPSYCNFSCLGSTIIGDASSGAPDNCGVASGEWKLSGGWSCSSGDSNICGTKKWYYQLNRYDKTICQALGLIDQGTFGSISPSCDQTGSESICKSGLAYNTPGWFLMTLANYNAGTGDFGIDWNTARCATVALWYIDVGDNRTVFVEYSCACNACP